MPLWPFIPIAFLSGSIPFGLIIARSRGVDIRKAGSGNIGATNVWRVMGAVPGLVCFALDVLKGLLPVLAAGWWAGLLTFKLVATSDAWMWMGVVVAGVLGHMYSPFAGFKGGKGVATGLGAMLGVYPLITFPALGCFAVWLGLAAIFRYVSLASCLAAVALPVQVWFFAHQRGCAGESWMAPFYVMSSLVALLVIARHRANIGRLLAGTENRIAASRKR